VSCGKLPKGVEAGRDVRCGRVSVPLDHARPGGKRIRLAVRVAQGGPRTPVLLLGGGPGESVVGLAGELARSKDFTVRKDRDVILVDQRGAGASRPQLVCTKELATAGSTVDGLAAAYGACGQRLGRTTDLGDFQTLQNAKDLKDVRTALGLRKMAIFGTSYGARLALVAAKGAPSWLSSLVLASPVPGDTNFVAEAPLSFDTALGALFADCAASPACATRYPRLDQQLAGALARLQAAPQQIPGAPPGTLLTADVAAGLVFRLFYSAAGVGALPDVIARLAAGDLGFLAQAANSTPTETISDGMQRAFMCSEELAYTSPEAIRAGLAVRSPAAQLVATTDPTIGLPSFALCGAFGVPKAPARTFAPVVSRTPTLVVTGRYDQITPTSFGQKALLGLPRGRLVTLPTGHSPLLGSGRCGIDILRAFLRRPTRAVSEPSSCKAGTRASAASAGDRLAALHRPPSALERLGGAPAGAPLSLP
jgi:pimeloyl-ACP methyl ester carboxylesterase